MKIFHVNSKEIHILILEKARVPLCFALASPLPSVRAGPRILNLKASVCETWNNLRSNSGSHFQKDSSSNAVDILF